MYIANVLLNYISDLASANFIFYTLFALNIFQPMYEMHRSLNYRLSKSSHTNLSVQFVRKKFNRSMHKRIQYTGTLKFLIILMLH